VARCVDSCAEKVPREKNVLVPIAIEIHTAIPIAITNCNCRPAREKLLHPQRFGDFTEMTVAILKNADRPPFARENQFGRTVAVEVSKHRATHDAYVLQRCRVFAPLPRRIEEPSLRRAKAMVEHRFT